MAAILSQFSTTGFYKAPVCKGLLCSMFLTCTAINVPLLAYVRKYLICRLDDVITHHQLWRLLTCRAAFFDTKDLVCGALLIYYFRVFERRMGSHKFGSFLFGSCVISAVLEFLATWGLHTLNYSVSRNGIIPPGPYGLIFPLFVLYFFDIPGLTQTHIVGIPVTGKSLTYLLGIQICSTSLSTLLSAACGIASGLVYRSNVCGVQQWLCIPAVLSRVMSRGLSWLLSSSPPTSDDLPMGATLEIQRQQQVEALEQRLMLNHAREMRGRPPIPEQNNFFGGLLNRRVPPVDGNVADNFAAAAAAATVQENNTNHADEFPVAAQEEQIVFLTDMGFQRELVVNALRSTGNNIEAATNILLQQNS